MGLTPKERLLAQAIECGIPLVHRPFAAIGETIGLSEHEVISILRGMIARGDIRRFGIIVRHHELGYTANAMTVMDIPDEKATGIGHRIASSGMVSLCYRRPRILPDWPYNIFFMIHGKDRQNVLQQIDALRQKLDLLDYPFEVLFSRRRFKQQGARYHTAADKPKTRQAADTTEQASHG